MSTDESSLPSVVSIRSRWEKIANDSNISSNISASTNTNNAGFRPSGLGIQTPTAIQTQPTEETMNPPSPSPQPPRTPQEMSSHTSYFSKPKPVVAPKPARLSSAQSVLQHHEEQYRQPTPEIKISTSSPTSKSCSRMSPTLDNRPAPPPPRSPSLATSPNPMLGATSPKRSKSPAPPLPKQHWRAVSMDHTNNSSSSSSSSMPPRRVVTPENEPLVTGTGTGTGGQEFKVPKSPKPPPPPPRRMPSSNSNPQLSQYSSLNSSEEQLSAPSLPPRPVSPVARVPLEHSEPALVPADEFVTKNRSNSSLNLSDDGMGGGEDGEVQDYPDTSQANRRAPVYEGFIDHITTKAEVRATASHGRYICVSGTATRMFDVHTGECLYTLQHPDVKICSVLFKIQHNEHDGRVVWLGTKDGHIWEVSIDQSHPVFKRTNCHLAPVGLIHQNGSDIWTLSEDGKLCVWSGDLAAVPKTFRTVPNFKACTAIDDLLWIGRNRQASVYRPSLDEHESFQVTKPIPAYLASSGRQAGEFSCAGTLPSMPDCVLFGHEDGTVTIYSIPELRGIQCVNVCTAKICTLRGVGHYLWLGLKTGNIMVCDVNHHPWKVLKEWKAHDGPINGIYCDDMSLKASMLPVLTCSSDLMVRIWDGLLKRDWIEMDMYQHDEEYSTFSDVKAHVITWNAGAAKPCDLEHDRADRGFLTEMLRSHGEDPELVVFGFQELVELDNKSVTAKTIFKKKKKEKEVSTSSNISHQYKAWQDRLLYALGDAHGQRYKLVHSNNMVGLFTCVFLKESMLPRLQGIRSSVVKTGLGGLHGNKGGLAVRMMLDNSSLCFVNCHLAAGQSGSMQRNKDIESILNSQLTDESVNSEFTGKGVFVNGGDGTRILDHEICFFSGDMNYRINTQRPVVMKMLENQEYDKLLELDQLTQQLKKSAGMRLRAFHEMAITFAPTYKFDVGTDNYDTSEKKRVPAWCDRIFYRGGKRVKALKYASHLVRVSDHRPVSGLYQVQVKTIDKTKRNETYKASLNRWNTFLQQAVDASRSIA